MTSRADRPNTGNVEISFEGRIKESKAFINVLDYGLTLLAPENLELKQQIIGLLIKKTRTLEKLMELGTKHAVQSSLYDLEWGGFINRHIKENIYSYTFNRGKILFKIKRDLETKHKRLEEEKKYYTSNDCLFVCDMCKQLYDYMKAMEGGFMCCSEHLKNVDTTQEVQKIMEKMTYLKGKLNSFAKL